VLQQLDEVVYRGLKHMNQSVLKNGLRSMQHLRAGVNGELPYKETPALAFGTLVHTVVLEPDLANEQYAIAPQVDRRTKGGRQEWEDFVQVNEGKTPVTVDDWNKAWAMREQVMAHPSAAHILKRKNAKVEHAAIWADQETGISCKAKIDFFAPGVGKQKPIIADLKTTMDAGPRSFAKSIASFNYHMQQAFYTDGVAQCENRHCRFVFIAVEKEPPYAVGVYELDEQAVEVGRKTYRNLLSQWKSCLESGTFTGYGDGVETLDLPEWAKSDPNLII